MNNICQEKNYKSFESVAQELKKIDEKNNAIYARLKDHPLVEKLIKKLGICSDSCFVMECIEKIDSLINAGKSYEDIFLSTIYCDDYPSNLAFLIHVEEKFKTRIISPEQLQLLTQINLEYMDDIKNSYYMAAEYYYTCVLKKILNDGGKYKDLIAISPNDFGLPNEWETMFNTSITKKDIIYHVMYLYIDDFFMSHLERVTLQDIAKQIEAPYEEIKKASEYH